MMDCYNEHTQEGIKQQIIDIAEEINDEMSKEKVDEKKVLKLRTQQLMQGLYLQTANNENKLY